MSNTPYRLQLKQVLLNNAVNYGLHNDQIIFHEEAAVQTINKNEVIRDLNKRITELEVELAKYKGAAQAGAADTVK